MDRLLSVLEDVETPLRLMGLALFASNDDPYGTAPAPGKQWIETGPHVMITSPGGEWGGYPRHADDPRQPYVMWPGTPLRASHGPGEVKAAQLQI